MNEGVNNAIAPLGILATESVEPQSIRASRIAKE